jgi:hypothetical protein
MVICCLWTSGAFAYHFTTTPTRCRIRPLVWHHWLPAWVHYTWLIGTVSGRILWPIVFRSLLTVGLLVCYVVLFGGVNSPASMAYWNRALRLVDSVYRGCLRSANMKGIGKNGAQIHSISNTIFSMLEAEALIWRLRKFAMQRVRADSRLWYVQGIKHASALLSYVRASLHFMHLCT